MLKQPGSGGPYASAEGDRGGNSCDNDQAIVHPSSYPEWPGSGRDDDHHNHVSVGVVASKLQREFEQEIGKTALGEILKVLRKLEALCVKRQNASR